MNNPKPADTSHGFSREPRNEKWPRRALCNSCNSCNSPQFAIVLHVLHVLHGPSEEPYRHPILCSLLRRVL